MDDESVLVTIFTPAYNVENYITKCIDSVLNQTFKNFEWIIVENASTDSTPTIIKKYEKIDSRIKVIHHTVNMNFFAQTYIEKYAKGKYIAKIDSDDWLEPDYLENLLYPMEKQNVDITICGALDYEQDTHKEFPHEYGMLNGIFEVSDIKKNFIEMRSYMGTYWGKMLRKDIFCRIFSKMQVVDQKLREGNNFGGDTAFILYYLMECRKIAFINKRMYHYRIHGKSNATLTMGLNRITCYVTLREIEKEFLNRCHAATKENILFVEISFWTNLEKLLKSVINDNIPLEKKLQNLHRIYTDSKIKQIREESYNSKIHTILSTYVAWYFMNMEKSRNRDLKDMLILLEPNIFKNISDTTYDWMEQQQELMAYIIMGEYIGAKEYIEKNTTENNKIYVSDLLKWL